MTSHIPSFLFAFALLHLIVQASTSPPCSTQEVNSSPRSSAFECFMHIRNLFQQKHEHLKIESIIEKIVIVVKVVEVTKGSPTQKKNVYIWALPKLRFGHPYCANPGTLWHNYFAENEKIL